MEVCGPSIIWPYRHLNGRELKGVSNTPGGQVMKTMQCNYLEYELRLANC